MSNNNRVEAIIIVGFLYGIQSDFLPKEEVNHRVEAFKHTPGFKEASQEIQKMLVEAETNGVAWAIKEIDYWHGASGGGEYGDKLYKGLKSKIRDSYQFETGLSDPAPNYPIKVKLQAVEQSIKDKE